MPTAAQQHLAALLREHPLQAHLPEKVIEVAQDLAKLNIKQNIVRADRAQLLLGSLEPVLPAEVRRGLANGSIVVGEIGLTSVNAFMYPLPQNEFAVVMHSGMFEFLYRIARPLAATVFRIENAPASGLEYPDFARIAAEIIWWTYQTEQTFGPDYPITLDQKILAGIIAEHAERFLLAHELGHVYLDLLRPDDEDLRSVSAAEEEKLADFFALRVCLASLPMSARTDYQMLALFYAGIELALQIWGVMESIGIPFVDTGHPPSQHRLTLIRGHFREHLTTDENFDACISAALTLQNAFDRIALIVQGPTEHDERFTREADKMLVEINELLDRYSGNEVPDYASFTPLASAVMERGYPEHVMLHVFQRVGRALSALAGQENFAENCRPHHILNQFKLLLSFASDMPEPARALVFSVLSKAMRAH